MLKIEGVPYLTGVGKISEQNIKLIEKAHVMQSLAMMAMTTIGTVKSAPSTEMKKNYSENS